MVIDRTTGKGCALSIAAKTVTRNLIADGIIGKTIAKKERPKRTSYTRKNKGTEITILNIKKVSEIA